MEENKKNAPAEEQTEQLISQDETSNIENAETAEELESVNVDNPEITEELVEESSVEASVSKERDLDDAPEADSIEPGQEASESNIEVEVKSEESLEAKEWTSEQVSVETTAEEESTEIVASLPDPIGSETEPEQIEASKASDSNVADSKVNNTDIEEIDDEEEEEHFVIEDVDYNDFDKKEFVVLAEKMFDAIKKSDIKAADVKNIDTVYRELRGAFDEKIAHEKSAALKDYIKENNSEDGFDYRHDNIDIRFESLMVQIREAKSAFYKKMEARREDYFETKTNLLQKLREIVEQEEKGGSRENWESFKQVQNDWRDAGNVSSPHNGSLWSAYNALIDRYFDIRSIQNELKELDRKKNLEVREEIVVKIEDIAKSLSTDELSKTTLKKANDLLNEYKHTGPGPRAEQEALWDRMKAAFDVIYDHRRKQNEESKGLMEEVLNAKITLLDRVRTYTEFDSTSINEWNAKTREVLDIQQNWNKLKGPMPREKAKDVSKDFWSLVKTFFKNKSAFFARLEAQREENLKAKQALCQEADAFLEAGVADAEQTNRIIELQKIWKTIGHVPEKFKDSIYEQFKKSCDAFFELKRAGNKEQEKSFKANLKAKQELCDKIEKEGQGGDADLSKLSDYKKQYAEIGFVPRADMNNIQKRFVAAINNYVKGGSNLNKSEKDKLILQNEVEVVMKTGGNPQAIQKQEHDLRRKLKGLEDEINQLKTNIEFFGNSKNADKYREEYQKKIEKAEAEAEIISGKLQVINAAS